MYLKRFVQLFVIFVVTSAVLVGLYITNFAGNSWLTWIVATIVAYVVLTLPLVILTVVKANKKANIVGTQTEKGELSRILKGLPGYIALSVTANERTSTTIMSFTQDTEKENIFYMVAEKDTSKVDDLKKHSQVSFTTWFDDLNNGTRLSTNKAEAEVLIGEGNKALIEAQPNILEVHENAVNMAIIKMTIQSVLFENFKDGLKVLDFEGA